MRDRVKEIKSKGFDMLRLEQEEVNGKVSPIGVDFSKIRIGAKTLEDAILNLGDLKKINPNLANKRDILIAIDNYDLKTLREVSRFFYRSSGIYSRLLRYLARLYNYDWFVTPYINDESIQQKKLLDRFRNCLRALDKFNVKKKLGEIALDVLIDGCYYAYKVPYKNNYVLQKLPVDYCRSRWFSGDIPAIEFNMRFFDELYRDTTQRMQVLKMFPPEFAKGYSLYKQGKLPPQFSGDISGWYLLEIGSAIKFNANSQDYPMFIATIPEIIDLDEAKDLDKKKIAQRLLKILVQKMPIDKNGDLVFDVDEAQQLHNNAVHMVSRAIGLEVLTTFADVEVESVSDNSVASAQSDDLERVERQVYNEAGTAEILFNANNSTALEKSILNDASNMYDLILQFEDFLNDIIQSFSDRKLEFEVQILKTTAYNFQEIAKLYKEQMQLGYSKMLAQVALGQSQSSILANAYFENDILDLVNVFIPPLMSSTMNAQVLSANRGNIGTTAKDGAGRPTNESQGKVTTEKTAANKEAAANN